MPAIGSTSIISTACGSTRRSRSSIDSDDHILAAIVRQVRSAGRGRTTFVVGENEPQHAELVRPAERGGYGLDALWNDDFHHSAMVALTGRHEAYYSDYRGRPHEFVAAAKHGFLYQGQRYRWQQKARGTPTLDLPAECFVVFLQNHDQVANSGTGERCHALTSPGRLRAMTAYLLLMPGIPMLFQGQEFARIDARSFILPITRSSCRAMSARGAAASSHNFPVSRRARCRPSSPIPATSSTFRRSVLDLGERQRHASIYALHRDLLALRRTDPVLGRRPCRIDGAALTDEAWMLRFFSPDGADRLLIVNLGRDLLLGPAPEPLLAPVEGQAWRLLWSSEAPLTVGAGARRRMPQGDWLISGQSATVLAPGHLARRPPKRGRSSCSEKPMVDLRRVIRDENPLPEAPREWLVANGLGGYASATITGAITRRYHGFLIAALPAPLGRMVVLNDLEIDIEREDGSVVNLRESGRFLDFTLNMGLPSWRYEIDGIVIETVDRRAVAPKHRAFDVSFARRRSAASACG